MKKIKYNLVAVICFLSIFLAACSNRDKVLEFAAEQDTEVQMAEERTDEQSAVASEGTTGTIYVHVCGAVNNPGVVELPESARVIDALQAAGGLREDGAEDYVNQAAGLEDGEQLYFPTIDEVQALREAENIAASGLVNINTADEELLCTLPGIGEAKAQAIISYREENGNFSTVQDIMNVPGIKQSAYEKIYDRIVVK